MLNVLWRTSLIGLALMAATFPADAGSRRNSDEPGGGVTAHSRFGNGSISGTVRAARYGYEVRLPGGNWVGCRRSCSETLRVQTVDIFENQEGLSGYGAANNECGIFGCLDVHLPR